MLSDSILQFLVAFVVVCLAGVVAGFPPRVIPTDAVRPVVKVSDGKGSCMGAVVWHGDQKVVVTAAHCIERLGRVRVAMEKTEDWFQAFVLYLNREDDIALLSCDQSWPALRVADQSVVEGGDYSVMLPKGDLAIKMGPVLGGRESFSAVRAYSGWSGSVVRDQDGNAVAVLTGGWRWLAKGETWPTRYVLIRPSKIGRVFGQHRTAPMSRMREHRFQSN